MFTVLFGLHLAIRAVIDWIWRGANQQNNLDLDRSATDQYDVPDAGGIGSSQRQAYRQSRSNKSTRWDDKRDDRAGLRKVERVHAEWTGFGNRKRVSHDHNNSSFDDVVVPIKVAHLSSEVVEKKTEKPFDAIKVAHLSSEVVEKKTENPFDAIKVANLSSTVVEKKTEKLFDAIKVANLSSTVVEKKTEKPFDAIKVANLSSTVVEKKTENRFNVEAVHGYQKMPFLSDKDTVDFIKQSHTMFIMRGLPGSGKSTLVKCLQEIYSGSVAVCSADEYFMNKDGVYKFNVRELQDAHNFSQDKAAHHCNKGTRVVIIDNTNIQSWTMKFYMKLAQNRHYYHVIIVEPCTPWRYEPAKLARRNKHNVDEGTISKKLQTLRDDVYRPMYYGWFLCKEDSSLLVKRSREALQQCVNEVAWPDLSGKDDSERFSAMEDILNNLVISYTDPVPMLHCTAAYLARRVKDPYHTNESVNAAIGRKFSLCISGFVYSKLTLSARVSLNGNFDDHTLKGASSRPDDLLTKAMERSKISNDDTSSQANLSEINPADLNEINQVDLYIKDEEEILREKYRDVHVHMQDSDEKHALFQRGCSAHVTISYATDGKSKQSGDDILNIQEFEFCGKVRQKKTSVGMVSAYGKDLFQLQLNQPFVVKSLFQGFYPCGR